MQNRFFFGLTQRFLLFFILTAVCPLLIVGSLLLNSVHDKLEERLTTVLEGGKQLTEATIQGDLEHLMLIASESIYLSLGEKFEDHQPIVGLLTQIREDNRLAICSIVNAESQTLVGDALTLGPSQKAMVQAVFQGRAVSSVEAVGPHIFYMVAVPMYAEESSNRIIGALVLGQPIQQAFSVQKLQAFRPALSLRIDQNTPAGAIPVLYSVSPGSTPDRRLAENKPLDAFKVTQERVQFSLKNHEGQPIGRIQITAPETDELDLERQGIRYTAGYMLVGLLLVAVAGVWFHYSFVKPVNDIAYAAFDVAEGDLRIRLPEKGLRSEIGRTIHSFNQMVERLEADQKLRHAFVSALTHDLRTPLLAEQRVLEALEEYQAELPADYVRLTLGLSASNRHLLKMVNDLLETYQYEAGKTPLKRTQVDLKTLVDEVLAQLAPLAEPKGIRLENRIDGACSRLEADASQLQRVFVNLIANGVENIPNHSAITVQAEISDGRWLKISIQDTGPGIPEDYLPVLFDQYSTGHPTQQKLGSGLGLSICKMMIEAHGGTIEVQSLKNQGTTFMIRLPV